MGICDLRNRLYNVKRDIIDYRALIKMFLYFVEYRYLHQNFQPVSLQSAQIY